MVQETRHYRNRGFKSGGAEPPKRQRFPVLIRNTFSPDIPGMQFFSISLRKSFIGSGVTI